MNTLKKLENTLIPSLVAGAVGAGAFYLIYGNADGAQVPLGPLDIPVWAAVGTIVAVGNAAGEVLTQFILPMIPKNEIFQGYEEMIVPPAISGLTTYLSMRFLVSDNTDLLQSVLFGAGSSIGGKYVYGMI